MDAVLPAYVFSRLSSKGIRLQTSVTMDWAKYALNGHVGPANRQDPHAQAIVCFSLETEIRFERAFFEATLKRLKETACISAIDQSVVVGQGQVHH